MTDTIWTPDLSGRDGPLYRAIADAIEAEARSGALAPGARLPPVRDLAWGLKATPGTVARAYKIAIDRGLLEAVVGRGTFVKGGASALEAARAQVASPASPAPPYLEMAHHRVVRLDQEAMITAALERVIRAHGGALPLTPYSNRPREAQDRALMADWLRLFNVKADPERILFTTGAQAAIHLALRVAAPGKDGVVLAPALVHPGILEVMDFLGLRVEPVALDDEGLIPEALDEACRRWRPDAIFIAATHHNPTTASMGLARREAVAAIARRRGAAIIEDDVYGWLDPGGANLPHFTELYPEGAWYVGGFAKSVAAGLRAGCLVAPPDRVEEAARRLRALTYHAPILNTLLVSELIRSGEAADAARRAGRETAARAAMARAALGAWGLKAPDLAGFAWLPLPAPWRLPDFISRALSAGTRVATSDAYLATPGAAAPMGARLALGPAADRAALEDGLRRIAEVLRAGPQAADVIA